MYDKSYKSKVDSLQKWLGITICDSDEKLKYVMKMACVCLHCVYVYLYSHLSLRNHSGFIENQFGRMFYGSGRIFRPIE